MRGFGHIETWVFDLDNTLYPASCRLFDQIDVKMGEFVSQALGVPYAHAKKRQKELFYRHGTTLRGLMEEHDLEPGDFLDYVHEIDYSPVKSDANLARALDLLPGRKLVFTNGTTRHAEKVLARLGVTQHFDGIFDIVDSLYVPKPERAPYEQFLTQHAIAAESAAMFEDIARNLEVPHALGMTTVLVASEDNRDANHLNGKDLGQHVHHVTSDLAEFLSGLPQARNKGYRT